MSRLAAECFLAAFLLFVGKGPASASQMVTTKASVVIKETAGASVIASTPLQLLLSSGGSISLVSDRLQKAEQGAGTFTKLTDVQLSSALVQTATGEMLGATILHADSADDRQTRPLSEIIVQFN